MSEAVAVEKAELLTPNLPDYDRSIVKIIPLGIHKKVSSKAIEGLAALSYILDIGVEPYSLKETESILYKGLNELDVYAMQDPAFAGKYQLAGNVDIPALSGIFGGNAPLQGELTETKPSAYQQICLEKSDRKKYLESLSATLLEAYEPMRRGFKSVEPDRKFGTLMNSIYSNEQLPVPSVIAVNSYLRSVYSDAKRIAEFSQILSRGRLTKFHEISKENREQELQMRGITVISPLMEKIAKNGFFLALIEGAGVFAGGALFAESVDFGSAYIPKNDGVAALFMLGGIACLIYTAWWSAEIGRFLGYDEAQFSKIQKYINTSGIAKEFKV